MVRLMSDTLLLTVKSDCIGSKVSKWEGDSGRKAAIAMVATLIEANCLLARTREWVGALSNKSLSWSPGSVEYAPVVIVVIWTRYQGPLCDMANLVPCVV